MAMNDDLKINFDKVGKACRQVGEEWKKMMRENNPFDTISNIAKDIVDRQDREIALEFTKCICELLKKNGVTPMLDEYRHESAKENSIECRYGVEITGLDFTEHDKPFERRTESLRCRCRKSAIDAFDNENYEILFIVTADELKNDELPTNPMEAAQMLIDAKYVRKTNAFDRFRGYEGETMEVDKYSIDDLEQIAEHLLVHCKHHREDEK